MCVLTVPGLQEMFLSADQSSWRQTGDVLVGEKVAAIRLCSGSCELVETMMGSHRHLGGSMSAGCHRTDRHFCFTNKLLLARRYVH